MWHLHVLRRILPCHRMLPHTLVGLPANVATLPLLTLSAVNLVPRGPFGPTSTRIHAFLPSLPLHNIRAG